MIAQSEAIHKKNEKLKHDIYRLEAEKKHLVRLLLTRRQQEDISENKSVECHEIWGGDLKSEKFDLFSDIETFIETFSIASK